MVEAQHVAATLKIVDDLDEQDVLESLLEASKPPPAEGTEELHYLLATPFRYPSRHGGTRFRGAADPGVFYGAQSVRTAAAELGYWRWRFLRDAVDLDRLEPVAHTAFRADIAIAAVDLREPPFADDTRVWRHPSDYSGTQSFARVAREAGVGGIVYGSVRDPGPGWCIALFTPAGFARRRPSPHMQTWFLAVSATGAHWRRDGESMRFGPEGWATDEDRNT